MTRRKGEVGRSQLARQWPHHAALPAATVRGFANSETVQCFARTLSAAPLTYHLRRDDRDYGVFCFAETGDGQVFAERFGGERLAIRR
jgi:hypothetical protein